MKHDLLSPLTAAVFTSILISTVLSLIFFFLYGDDFTALSFLTFFAYFLGKIGVIFFIISVLGFSILFLLRKVTQKILFKRSDFVLFLSGFIVLTFSITLIFFVNFNVLRYSREFISYFINLLIVILGLLIFMALYKTLSLRFSITKHKITKKFSLLAILIMVSLSFINNPFEWKNPNREKSLNNRREYDYNGNYLYSESNLNSKKLNIILLSIDTLREDGLSCYGNQRKTSPNIDKLSNDSLIFKNVFSQSSWTLPSHMTMITSLYPSTHGCTTSPIWTGSIERLSDRWITLAEVLKQAGYRTAAFTDGQLLGPKFNFDQGFDICDDSGGGIKKISQKAISWMEDMDGDEPFFLFLHCYDVHNYMPPKKFEQMFIGEYDGKLLKYRKRGKALPKRITANAFYNLSEDDISYVRALYDAEIFATDFEFGKILDYLKSKDLYEEAVIMVTSDHGEEFWEHGGTGHGWSLHQHQLKVPLIWKAPFFPDKGKEIFMSAGLIDIYPTLLEGLGIPIPFEAQGLSLMPYLKGQEYPSRSFLAEASHLKNQKCLIKEGYSYLYNYFPPIGENLFNIKRLLYAWRAVFQARKNELYDLNIDPGETKNVINLNQERAKELKNEMFEFIYSYMTVRPSLEIPAHQLDEQSKKELRSLGYIK